MQQHDEVELSALGMGIEIPLVFFPLLFLEIRESTLISEVYGIKMVIDHPSSMI